MLATTAGDATDLPRIEELLRTETRSDIRDKLQAAKHRVESAGIGEALVALNDLLQLGEPPARLDPSILVSNPAHHDRFVNAVDVARARAAADHDPASFIAAAINVTDQMVDLMVLAEAAAPGAEVSAKKRHAADLIRNNAAGRQEVGVLLGQQQMQQDYSWFATCLTLRQMRTAHPSPLGTTKPLSFTADHGTTAKMLFAIIAAGWIHDMHRLARGGACL